MKVTDESFVGDNLGLVHSCCKRFVGKGIEYDDLFQAGCIGLVKAQKGFDPERGIKFSTYAVPVILGEVRHLFREGGSIKVSRIIMKQASELLKLREKFLSENFREPTTEELSRLSGMSIEEVTLAIGSSKSVCSIDESVDEDKPAWQISDGVGEDEFLDKLSLKCAIDKLDGDEQKLIELRYFQDKTQSQTAKQLGISQVQVSRRERAVILKLRKIMVS